MKIQNTLLTIFALFLFFAGNSKENAKQKQPNIIFIFADDWGFGDLSCHGSTFCKTPTLDKMASEGIDFQNFSVCNPVCSPSRTAVVTGQFPARHSVHGHFATVQSHVQRGMPDWLDPQATQLQRMLKNAGYATAHFGKWHLSNDFVKDAPSPLAYGYDEYGAFNLPGQLHQMHVDSTMIRTIDFVKRHKNGPFFINAWIHATHTPHYPKEKYMQQFADLNEQQQVYAAVVAEYDELIGQLFAILKELGIDNNTLVMFSSDNGPEFTGKDKNVNDTSTGPGLGSYYSVGETGGLKGRKRSLFAGGVRVPFLVRWPGVVTAGLVDKITDMATVDLLPTFVELAGASYPKGYQPDGVSILSAIKGKPFKREKPIYWQWLYANNRTDFWPSAAVQDGNWKMLTNEKSGKTELYNIATDWAEQKDLANVNPEKVKSLTQKINAFEESLPKNPPSNCFSKERQTLQISK